MTIPDGALVAVVDGLGHGSEAADVAKTAVRSLERHASQPVISLLRQCHGALSGTRGAVSLAAFGARRDDDVARCGERRGPAAARPAATSQPRELLLLRGGVVGVHLPALSAALVPAARATP